MPASRAKTSSVRPEPWWAKYMLAMVKMVLAFALAVLTLVFAQPRKTASAPAPLALPPQEQPPGEDQHSAP